jgi:hypothetical protein
MTYPPSLKVFRHAWDQLAPSYAVTNNDAALIFRAITEMILLPHISGCVVVPMAVRDSLGDRIERMVACFPPELAPLCRDLAQVCVQRLQHEIATPETAPQAATPV